MTLAQSDVMEMEAPPSAPAAVPEPIRILEAMLFASAQPLTIGAIRARLPEDADVGGMLKELQQAYETRGVNLIELDGSWAFRTSAALSSALQVTKDVQRKLSRAAMETLAIIAYHQPVTRAEIENIRGVVTHKGMLDVLIEAGWVKPGRRRETPGRPLTWVTTTSFLDQFGLETLTDLPGLDDLKASGLLDRRPAIDNVSLTGELFGEEQEQLEADAAGDEEEDETAFEDEFDDGDETEGEEAEDAADEEDGGDDEDENDDEDADEDEDSDDDDDDFDDEDEDDEEDED